MTPAEYFKTLASKLELTKSECDRISQKHNFLREKLHAQLSVEESFLTGSYIRNTMIRSKGGVKYDVDFFLVFDNEKYGHLDLVNLITSVNDALGQIQSTDRDITNIVNQKRSIAVIYNNDFQIDVVPAVQVEKDKQYKIFDTASQAAITSNPKLHSENLTIANEATASGSVRRLVPIIKLLKFWKREKCDYLKSFHLELLVVRILKDDEIVSFSSGIGKFFKDAGEYLQRPTLVDPANTKNIIDAYLDTDKTREALIRLIADEKEISDKALGLEAKGDSDAATSEWKKIFQTEDDKGKNGNNAPSSSGPIIIHRTPARPHCTV